jgi:hypothetical protein
MRKVVDTRAISDKEKRFSVFGGDPLAGDWSADSEKSPEFAAENLDNATTHDIWLADDDSGEVTLDLGEAKAVNFVGIIGVKLSDYELAYSDDDISYTVVGDAEDAITAGFMFDEVVARYWRIAVDVDSGYAGLRVAFVGTAFRMTQPVYGGVKPITLARQTDARPDISESGQWLGGRIQRRGFGPVNVSYMHLEPDFVRSTVDPFADDRRAKPFFWAWRPAPGSPSENEIAYCRLENDIQPENMGVKNYMQVDMTIRGFGDV